MPFNSTIINRLFTYYLHEIKSGLCEVLFISMAVYEVRTLYSYLSRCDIVIVYYGVGVQRGQSYLMGRRCLFNLG